MGQKFTRILPLSPSFDPNSSYYYCAGGGGGHPCSQQKSQSQQPQVTSPSTEVVQNDVVRVEDVENQNLPNGSSSSSATTTTTTTSTTTTESTKKDSHSTSGTVEGLSQQEPAVYVGPMEFVFDSKVLTDLQIKAVVSLLPSCPVEVTTVLTERGIDPASDHLCFPLEDSREAYLSLFHPPGIHSVLDFIHTKRKEGKQVLVHCDKGLTRSPAVLVAYLMKYGPKLTSHEPLSYSEAASILIRQRGPKVDIRIFDRELRKLEHQLERHNTSDDQASTVASSTSSICSPRSELLSPVILSQPKPRQLAAKCSATSDSLPVVVPLSPQVSQTSSACSTPQSLNSSGISRGGGGPTPSSTSAAIMKGGGGSSSRPFALSLVGVSGGSGSGNSPSATVSKMKRIPHSPYNQ